MHRLLLIIFVILLHVPDELDLDKAMEDAAQHEVVEHSVKPKQRGYSLSIEAVTTPAGRYTDTLDIIYKTAEGDGAGLAGFDLKIAVENEFLEILKILPGEIPDSCGWQHFMTRENRKDKLTALPPVIWHITGLAQTIPDKRKPKCLGFDRPATIARLVVGNAHIREMPDTTVPIFFIWEDCTDNVISDNSGSSLIMSDNVSDRISVIWNGNSGEFPTKDGTPNSCINRNLENAPQRLLELNNGGVYFKYQFNNLKKSN